MASTNTTLPPVTQQSTQNCTAISDLCPVEATIYGYYPSLGANAFFCAIFAICFFAQFFQGIRWKTWTYMIALTLGSFAEAVGYVGRILLHNNPWSNDGFEIQICCLIIAPAFIAAGIYLTLKHIVLEFGSDFSRLRPKYYTWIFILCDLFSLILQGAGGGIAATANKNVALQHTGNDLMMAGIVWQVFTLLVFGSLVADYASRAYQRRTELAPSAIKLFNTLRFKLFAGGLILTYLTVFTRCVFRIAEMAKGWKNPIMQDETDFIVLDGVMITIATLCLTVFHPGYCFPEMQMHGKTNPLAEFMAVDAEKVADPESNTPSLDGAEQPKSMDGKTNPQPEFMAADAEKGADRESNTPSLNGVEQPKS